MEPDEQFDDDEHPLPPSSAGNSPRPSSTARGGVWARRSRRTRVEALCKRGHVAEDMVPEVELSSSVTAIWDGVGRFYGAWHDQASWLTIRTRALDDGTEVTLFTTDSDLVIAFDVRLPEHGSAGDAVERLLDALLGADHGVMPFPTLPPYALVHSARIGSIATT
jgi:hypothetical protein